MPWLAHSAKADLREVSHQLSEYKELDRRARKLYKELLPSNLFKGNEIKRELADLFPIHVQLRADLLQDGRKIYQNLVDIKKLSSECRVSCLGEASPDLHRIHKMLENIESAFSDYRDFELKSMENLLQQESHLLQECILFDEKLNSPDYKESQYSLSTGVSKARQPLEITAPATLPAVAAFQTFLANSGGRSGGWRDCDHQTFIRIRRRYARANPKKSLPPTLEHRFIQDVASVVLMTTDDVTDHERWWMTLNNLELASKEALRERRRTLTGEPWTESESSAAIIPRVKSAPDQSTDSNASTSIARHQRQRELVDAWRESRNRQLENKFLMELETQKALREQEEQKRQARNKKLRMQVELFRQRKLTDAVSRAQSQSSHRALERSYRQSLSKLDEERIRERSAHLLRQQLQRKEAKAIAQAEQEQRLQRAKSVVSARVARDPQRATGPTEIFNMRLRALTSDSSKSQVKPVFFSMDPLGLVPQKATPQWRRGLPSN